MRYSGTFDINRLMRLTEKARRRVLFRQGAYTRKAASRKIRRRKTDVASPAGTPPYTHTGALKRAIRYGMTRESVLIGPTHSQIGRIGHTHEFGGVEKAKKSRKKKNNWDLSVGGHGPIRVEGSTPFFAKIKTSSQARRAKTIASSLPDSYTQGKPRRRYPKRPFMKPTLIDVTPDLPKFWADAVTR